MKTPVYSGIITNYTCTASCRHCMFASSPACEKDFITPEMSEHLASLLEEAGTRGVHIGGGEPFMNFPALCSLIEALNRHGIGVDYIETNAFWAADTEFARKRLLKLKELGVDCVMVSVDPFHIEYVPLERPLLLIRLLRECGMDYFIWKEQYLWKLMKLDHSRTYQKEELQSLLTENYITETAEEYGLGMNGRALAIARDMFPLRPAEFWLKRTACPSIGEVQHCHLDLYGNLIPSRCTGLAAEARDYLSGNLPAESYPVLSRLHEGGTKALYDYALSHGFQPDPAGYPSHCALCYDMRRYLRQKHPSADLEPGDYYREMDQLLYP